MKPTVLLLAGEQARDLIVLQYSSHHDLLETHLLLAHTGEAALDFAAHGAVDCAVIDEDLPDMHGLELCALLRSNESCATFPLILIAPPEADADFKTAAHSHGVAEVLFPPLFPNRAVSIIMSKLPRTCSERLPAAENVLEAQKGHG